MTDLPDPSTKANSERWNAKTYENQNFGNFSFLNVK